MVVKEASKKEKNDIIQTLINAYKILEEKLNKINAEIEEYEKGGK